MTNDNNINNYTAADIEKYHKGLLSANEMHEMEKAALEDAFLADALEGYAAPGVNTAADLEDLNKRLADKSDGPRVIPIHTKNNDAYRLLKVAAVIILIAGAGFLVYQLGFYKKATEIAQADTAKNGTVSSDTTTANFSKQNTESDNNAAVPNTAQDKNEVSVTDKAKKQEDVTKQKEENITPLQQNGIKENIAAEKTDPMANALPKTGNEKNDEQARLNKLAEDDNLKKSATKELAAGQVKSATAEKNNMVSSVELKTETQLYREKAKLFTGRVTDSSNIGIPFANVTNLEENAGTYTDAHGFFNLTYPDSIMQVLVKSIGFENRTIQLKNNVTSNKIVLKGDHNSLLEIVIGNKLPNTAERSSNASRTLEEPVPADGWPNYDAYLVNNLKIPEKYETRPTSYPSVQVSFELDNNGQPTNFKIEKSLCNQCDREAIRLIKEGPKWKKTAAKKGRTTVTINFE